VGGVMDDDVIVRGVTMVKSFCVVRCAVRVSGVS
jgi:hypothetical protein